MREIVHGSTVHSFCREWRKSSFIFQDSTSPYPWGLQTQRVSKNTASYPTDSLHVLPRIQISTLDFFSVSLTVHVIDNQSDLLMENFPHAYFSFILINYKMIVKCCSGWHTMNAFRTIHWQTLFKSPFLLLQKVTEVKSF